MTPKRAKRKILKTEERLPPGVLKAFEAGGKATLLDTPLIHLLIIIVCCFIVYSNTFHVPFFFDDLRNITGNPLLKNDNYSLMTSSRLIGYLSFKINYQLHGTQVLGYHVMNISIHMINGLLAYLLVLCIFKTPLLRTSKLAVYSGQIAFFVSLLFVVHPIQTQAVTYIVQRFTSLATMFYLLSLVFYLTARLGAVKRNGNETTERGINFSSKPILFYILSLFSTVLAMKTKEIAFTIPVMIMAAEFIFFNKRIAKKITWTIPFLLTLFIIPLGLISVKMPGENLIAVLDEKFRMGSTLSRWDYLFTQFRVIVTYLRLMIFPVNQNLDYDYPVYHAFFIPEVFLSFLLLISIVLLGYYLWRRYRNYFPHVRIIVFGIFWFFLALSVESSIIPISDVIYEHRLYLPTIGFFMVIVSALYVPVCVGEGTGKLTKWIVHTALIVSVVVFGGMTYARNTVWQNQIHFWQDVVEKSQGKARPHHNLADAYLYGGKVDEAIAEYRIALTLAPDLAEVYNNLGNAYISKDMVEQAIEQYQMALRLKPENAKMHGNLGNIYLKQGKVDKAFQQYQIALGLMPDNADVHFNLGVIYLRKNNLKKALEEFRTALQLNPEDKEARAYIQKLTKKSEE